MNIFSYNSFASKNISYHKGKQKNDSDIVYKLK